MFAVDGYTWWQTFDIFLMAGLVIVAGLLIAILFAPLVNWLQKRQQAPPPDPAKEAEVQAMQKEMRQEWDRWAERNLSPLEFERWQQTR